jgi:hypothetical protein
MTRNVFRTIAVTLTLLPSCSSSFAGDSGAVPKDTASGIIAPRRPRQNP